jgi:hypothetical protein
MSKVSKRALEAHLLDLAIAVARETIAETGKRPALGALVEVTELDRQFWTAAFRLEVHRQSKRRPGPRKRGAR